MTYAESLWLYTLLVLGIIAVPGMDMIYVLANALTGGRAAGLSATAGVMLGGAAHALFGVAGVGLVIASAPSLFTAMLLAGAAYMAWIGYTLIRSSITVDGVGRATSRSPAVAFRQGFVTCILNPKAYLFVLAVMPQFVLPQYGPLWRQAVVIGLITVAMQFAIYGGLALAAGRSRDFLTARPDVTVLVGRGAGALFVAMAAWTVWRGLA